MGHRSPRTEVLGMTKETACLSVQARLPSGKPGKKLSAERRWESHRVFMDTLFPEGVQDQRKLKRAYDLINRHLPDPGTFQKLLGKLGQRDDDDNPGPIEKLNRKSDALRAKRLLGEAGADPDVLDKLFSSSS